MKHLCRVAAASIALAACSPCAFATATATATLNNLRYQLFDLDPSDGVTPAVMFDAGSAASTFATADDYATWEYNYISGPLGSGQSISSIRGTAIAFAVVTPGEFTGSGATPVATAQASATGSSASALSNTWAVYSGFTLTPRTLLVFVANGTGLLASRTLPGEAFEAALRVQLESVSDAGQLSVGQTWMRGYSDGTGDSNVVPLITASFSNLSATPVSGFARAFASAYATGAGPVPEPNALLMFFVGLSGLAAAARRSRRK
jgi:hypothetical protein